MIGKTLFLFVFFPSMARFTIFQIFTSKFWLACYFMNKTRSGNENSEVYTVYPKAEINFFFHDEAIAVKRVNTTPFYILLLTHYTQRKYWQLIPKIFFKLRKYFLYS